MKKIFTTLTAIALFFGSFAQNVNTTFRSHMRFPGQTCANICGYKDALGNEYALVGTKNGMTIVDVTNPSSPVFKVQIPEPTNNSNTLWQEIKVFKHYAYVATEAGGGLQIVDLINLPATNLTYHNYTGDGVIAGQLNTIHALHIDTTKKYVYTFGGNFQGAVALNINVDPYNPTYAGIYNSNYIHDGYVDNDTLYGAHIWAGYFSVINFTNKSAPVVLATQPTPNTFTHNTWPSKNKKILFTTDEVANSYLASYDISNLNNITLLDKIQSNPGSNSWVHNTHIRNDTWAVTSWYGDGITIVDVTRPQNLIQVGNYDECPQLSGNIESGCWGVYPFLPSGTIVISDIDSGLFVISPNYVRACYLEGTAIDSVTTLPLNNVMVHINTVNVTDYSDPSGIYRTGTAVPGTYSVTYTKAGYYPLTYSGLVFTPGNVVNKIAKLVPFGTKVVDANYLDASVNVFPNPFNNETQLQYKLTKSGIAKLTITDITGRIVQETELMNGEGSITIGAGLAKGVYTVQIKQGDVVSSPTKLIKAN